MESKRGSFEADSGEAAEFLRGKPLVVKMEAETRGQAMASCKREAAKFPLCPKQRACSWSDGLQGRVNGSRSGIASTINNLAGRQVL